jgi:deoxyribodipyrimidine photolyase-related protein
MSNFCGHCQFDPTRSTGPGSCPFTSLYWTFLERNKPRLEKNFRMLGPYRSLANKSSQELVQLRARAAEAVSHLASLQRPAYSEADTALSNTSL